MTSVSDAGRALSAARRRTTVTCVQCGASFGGLANARYCSRRCRNAAYWTRHGSEINARRRERKQRGE